MKFSEIFKRDYYDLMLRPGHPANPIRNRADSFLKVFQLLEEKEEAHYCILETGCMRQDHGSMCFGDDGCSSFLFNEFLKYNNGQLISVDINQKNVDYANSFFTKGGSAKAFCSDSVEFIKTDYYRYGQNDESRGVIIDLLYLDSFDITKENPGPSQEHHLKEFNAARPFLGKGSIIVVDDHNAFFTDPPIGKGNLVREAIEKMSAKKIFEDYQIGWVL
jgi:hypothetical protein